ncbi:D-serine deaminase-like pyridoxal phosphate-dependent protein [Hamadaea flava]|uniref:Alanine racemase n=1 Tax=Hamadaea flava TaxID=1742688 RepID=A0ABV8LRN2_9ACTN|nr:alanine racemase [Hamadaea flava]MCP2322465.1 D-serine deaminase-like pyridoxal phosphate-dependent protein [Hamadaea flava]
MIDLSLPAAHLPVDWPEVDKATADLDPPFGTVHLGALRHNAQDMVRRAGPTPIRVASKSIRSRELIAGLLALPGYRGVLAYTLAEAMWLAVTLDDVVVGYPTADRAALTELALSPELAARVTLMVDSVEQLDFIDAVVPQREPLRVCVEIDSSYRSRLLGHVGVWRSPIRQAPEAAALAREIVRRPGFTLVGMMGYEAQIAGLGNAPRGKPLMGRILRTVQKRSMAELIERRSAAVAAVRRLAELEFVNGGGTGSLEATASDPSVTEVTAGSGLLGPHLFDNYAHFHPAPAAAFALSVVRRPAPDRVTLLGGGWIASGPPGPDRLPQLVWPAGLSYVAREAAGEVQTPVTGAAARSLRVGDRVWLRHTKAGEVCEHVDELYIVDGPAVVGAVRTYRGERKVFL